MKIPIQAWIFAFILFNVAYGVFIITGFLNSDFSVAMTIMAAVYWIALLLFFKKGFKKVKKRTKKTKEC